MNRKSEIHVFLRGGLGNQLFQYSTGISISKKTGKKLVLRSDLLPETQDSIGRISRWPNQITSFEHSGEVRVNSFQPSGKTNLFGKKMQVMRTLGDIFPKVSQSFGWLSAEKVKPNLPNDIRKLNTVNSYVPFKEFAYSNSTQIRNEIEKVLEPSPAYIELFAKIKKMRPSIVHVRQGDYTNLRHIYGELNLDYFKSAANLLDAQDLTRELWIFTDSPNLIPPPILKTLRPSLVVGPETVARPIENLVLLSQANAIVAANSSFSWWACLLSKPGTRIIAPRVISAAINNFDENSEPCRDWEFLDA